MSGAEFESFCSQAQVILGGSPLDRHFLGTIWDGADKDLNRAINHLLGIDESKVVRAGDKSVGNGKDSAKDDKKDKKEKKEKKDKKDKKDKADKQPQTGGFDAFTGDAFGTGSFAGAQQPPSDSFGAAGGWGPPQSAPAGMAGMVGMLGHHAMGTAPMHTGPPGGNVGQDGFGGMVPGSMFGQMGGLQGGMVAPQAQHMGGPFSTTAHSGDAFGVTPGSMGGPPAGTLGAPAGGMGGGYAGGMGVAMSTHDFGAGAAIGTGFGGGMGGAMGAHDSFPAAASMGHAQPIDGGWGQPSHDASRHFATMEHTGQMGAAGGFAGADSDSDSDNDWWHQPLSQGMGVATGGMHQMGSAGGGFGW